MMSAASRAPAAICLSELLQGFANLAAADDRPVGSLAMDSRDVQSGGLFLACRGGSRHGMKFIDQALQRGAVAVVAEPDPAWTADRIGRLAESLPIPVVAVFDLSTRVSQIAGRFYGDPSGQLTLVGVTGTNGKTSCTQFLANALGPAIRCGIIGTLGSGFPEAILPGTHTTPDPVRLQAIIADLRARGAEAVAMEVSSHALDQGRTAGLSFDVAVLTNLSRDHLDYHGSMLEYGIAKKRLFQMPGLGCSVLNLDDPFADRLLCELPAGAFTIGYGQSAGPERFESTRRMVQAVDVQSDETGMRIAIQSSWGEGRFETALLGRFNVSNLLAVLAVLLYLDVPLANALDRLSHLATVPGRMEHFGGGRQPLVVVDYAHTPDALEHVLTALRGHVQGELLCVFGCGGDRDQGKRPQMAAIAESLASCVIVTDDNPRGEDGDLIVQQILAGMTSPEQALVERDRARAIRRAISLAEAGDLVLVAGKGHETSQQVGDLKLPFDDRQQVLLALQEFPR